MNLPFLKQSKMPRVAKPQVEKIVGLDPSDEIIHQCAQEMIDHYHNKNARGFHQALRALANEIRMEKMTNAS